MSNPSNKREQVLIDAKRSALAISEMLSTSNGEVFLKELERAFGGAVCAENAHQTVIHAAYRDVLDWIEQVQARGEPSE